MVIATTRRTFRCIKDGKGMTPSGEQIRIHRNELFITTHEHEQLLYGCVANREDVLFWVNKIMLQQVEVQHDVVHQHHHEDMFVECVHAFDGQNIAGALSLGIGDLVQVTNENGGWYYGISEDDREGIFPMTFVRILDDEDDLELSDYEHEIEIDQDEESKAEIAEIGDFKSLRDRCGEVLMEQNRFKNDILSKAVLEDISTHCSKRFARMILLELDRMRDIHRRERMKSNKVNRLLLQEMKLLQHNLKQMKLEFDALQQQQQEKSQESETRTENNHDPHMLHLIGELRTKIDEQAMELERERQLHKNLREQLAKFENREWLENEIISLNL